MTDTARRRIRLACLLGLLAAALLTYVAKGAGYFAFLEAPEFRGRLALGDGDLVVEQVDLKWPPARLVVARIPRGRGYRLRAVLVDPKTPLLKPVGVAAEAAGALVAVNGDYHTFSGVGGASPYSTLIDRGHAHSLGSPFGYAAQFWLDGKGAPHAGRMGVGARVVRSDGASLDVTYNISLGQAVVIDRHLPVWTSDERVGLPLAKTEGSSDYVVLGPLKQSFTGPALLVSPGTAAHTFALETPPESVLRFERTGDHASAQLAIGTGPQLISGGVIPESALDYPDRMGWANRFPRTAVGFDGDSVVLVTTLQAPRCGLSMLELARVMQALGCQEAINLDGGPSTTLWAKTGWQGGRTLNLPKGVTTDEPVATALLVLPPLKGTPGLR